MIRSLLSFIFFVASASSSLAQGKPESYSLDRYSVIWKKSMFAPKTSDEKTPNGSVYWSLAGIFSYKEGKGAVIVNQLTGAVEQVETNKKNDSGLVLVEVMEDPESGVSGVKIENEGEFFWVIKQTSRKPSSTRKTTDKPLLTNRREDGTLRRAVASQ